MPDDPCAFAGCGEPAARTVTVDAAAAASWALLPSLQEQVDRIVERLGAGPLGLRLCADHADGVAPRAQRPGYSDRQRRLLRYLENRPGGTSIADIAVHFGWTVRITGPLVQRLVKGAVLERAGSAVARQGRRRAVLYRVRPADAPRQGEFKAEEV